MDEYLRRIARVVESDAEGEVKTTLRVVGSDIAAVMNEFMSVDKLGIAAEKTEGGYKIVIEANVGRIYSVGKTSEPSDD